MEYCLCLLLMFSLLGIGQGLNLQGKNATQSSTIGSNYTASKAIDEDNSTHIHTDGGRSAKWWVVDLEQTYCLRKITVVSRLSTCCVSRLAGAVVRAGLSSNYLDNTAIGSPVSYSQVTSGAVLDFEPADRFVTARYVSVDLPSAYYLTFAEVRIEELMDAAGASSDNGIDFTVVTFPPLLGQTGNDDAFIGTYKADYDVSAGMSYGRQVITGGTNEGLPAGSGLENGPSFYCPYVQLNLPQEGGIDRVGVFYSEANKQDLTNRIQTIILHKDGYIRPLERTLTVNVGDDITLRMEDRSAPNSNYRWKHNDDAMDEWYNDLTGTIPKVTAEHAGIYSCFISGEESQRLHGIMRLIVRDCPKGLWGPPSCLNVCRRCYNGGICDDVTGRCICAPGFSGNDCGIVHGRNIFGIDAGSSCSGNLNDLHNDACRGRLFCQRDPYGCSCAAGYTGLDCNQECTEGMYGADCKQTCNCASGTCKKDTGDCDNGCQSPYFGSNCQCSTGRRLLGVQVISDFAVQLDVSWSPDSCATDGYRIQYQLANTGLCGTIPPQEPTTMDFNQPTSSYTINGLVMHSTYIVSVRAIYNGDIEGLAVTATAVTGVTFSRADVSLAMTDDPRSITVTWAPDLCVIHTVEYALRNQGGCQLISEPIDYVQHCMCNGSSSTTTISHLFANSLYTVKMTVDIPRRNPQVTQDITTGEGAPTNPPPEILTTSIMQRNLSFSWSQLPCEDRGGTIIGYSYKLDQIGFGIISDTTTTKYVTISGLIPFTEYSFQVAAMTAADTGPFSGSLVHTTHEAAPTVPLNVMVIKVDDVSIEIQWSEPDPPHGIITRYNIRYGRLGLENDQRNVIKNLEKLAYRVSPLELNVTYTIEVRAWTAVGPGPWSEAIAATTRIAVSVSAKPTEPTPTLGPGPPAGIIAGVLIAVFVVVIAVIGIVVYRRRAGEAAGTDTNTALPMDIRNKNNQSDDGDTNPEYLVIEEPYVIPYALQAAAKPGVNPEYQK